MVIAGGLYIEQCCLPFWDEYFGSGGRAAAALSNFSDEIVLHSYCEKYQERIDNLSENYGFRMNLSHRESPIVFSYFHPLSTPHIQPSVHTVDQNKPIVVEGEAVLRFGFLEGDAIVKAHRAVFDPQTSKFPKYFDENGSEAEELAIVLNETELKSLGGKGNIPESVEHLIYQSNASVVVVKQGVFGSTVFQANGQIDRVPAYKSSYIFKIGTGDIFSAIFSFYWANLKIAPLEAAHKASLAVAEYCHFGALPSQKNTEVKLSPISSKGEGAVLLLGQVNSLSRRYIMEEARHVLLSLGINVICPILDKVKNSMASAALVLGETYLDTLPTVVNETCHILPTVLLMDKEREETYTKDLSRDLQITDDFSTAMYKAAWAAIENAKYRNQ